VSTVRHNNSSCFNTTMVFSKLLSKSGVLYTDHADDPDFALKTRNQSVCSVNSV
jgi:hypothetical protein